jgi:hypothetical protein
LIARAEEDLEETGETELQVIQIARKGIAREEGPAFIQQAQAIPRNRLTAKH